MATNTPNYNLRKPDGTDFVTVATDLDANWDIVDTQLKAVSDRAPAVASSYDHWISPDATSTTSGVAYTISNWARVGGLTNPNYVSYSAGTWTFTRAGLYIVTASNEWSGAAGGRRLLSLVRNGFNVRRASLAITTADIPILNLTHIVRTAVGDTMRVDAQQNSGAALTLSSALAGHDFQLARIGD